MKTFKTNDKTLSAYIDGLFREGRNPKATITFHKDKLYSYNSLLANIDRVSKIIFIDKYIKNYSITTGKQSAYLLKQIPNSYKVLIIELGKDPKEVLMDYWKDVEEGITKHSRAYKNKEYYKNLVRSILNEAEVYIETMSIKKTCKEYKYRSKLIKNLFEQKML